MMAVYQRLPLVKPLTGKNISPPWKLKGATFTELRVYQQADGVWVAQCIVDV